MENKDRVKWTIQWGSDIWPFEIQTFSKIKFQKGRAIALAIAMVPAIKKPDQVVYFDQLMGPECSVHQTAEQKPFLMI